MAIKEKIKKRKQICCIGAGYVGGPTMAVIAQNCPDYDVTVVDINKQRIKDWNGDLDKLPIYEPGLSEIVDRTRNKNLFFSNNIDQAIKNSEIIFMAVNTPTKKEGEGKGMATDLSFVEDCAKRIALNSESDKIIVEKSTAPLGTALKIKEILKTTKMSINFEVISNPEFLAEGTAIKDLQNPDRVLIGGEESKNGNKAVEVISRIYTHWVSKDKIITTNLWSSELSKLASNAFLAQRISSINSLSALCDVTGANIKQVSKAIGSDSRIGNKFLEASVGFGGSCFKKDILNLVYLCKYYGLEEVSDYWHQVVKINSYQKNRLVSRIIDYLNKDVINKNITILGWAFKKNTNDTRESASIDVATNLLQKGAKISIYDPMVSKKSILNDIEENLKTKNFEDNIISKYKAKIKICKSIIDASKNSECIAILTEWDEFKTIDWSVLSNNSSSPLFVADGRNILNIDQIRNKVDKYISVGNSKF
jgi:UDPglucose 6-dehydrogenase